MREITIGDQKLKLPKGYKIIRKPGKTNTDHCDSAVTVIKRPDGLTVFLSPKDDPLLNVMRIKLKDKTAIITSVSIYRGLQIARSYERAHTKNTNFQDVSRKFSEIVRKRYKGRQLRRVVGSRLDYDGKEIT